MWEDIVSIYRLLEQWHGTWFAVLHVVIAVFFLIFGIIFIIAEISFLNRIARDDEDDCGSFWRLFGFFW